jgi:uncharacterized protein YjbJ (UPF0337 family)
MDKDRIVGAAKVIKGRVKEAIGKVTGDAKLKTEGKADKVEGKVQNAIGSVRKKSASRCGMARQPLSRSSLPSAGRGRRHVERQVGVQLSVGR